MTAVDDSVRTAVQAALSKKAEEVIVLDVSVLCGFAQTMVVCHGHSRRQVQTVAEEVTRTLREHGVRPHHVEGKTRGEWILLDYIDFVVHIFLEERRRFFALERLWGDAPRLEVGSGPGKLDFRPGEQPDGVMGS
ncbi:MAG: ribosome silencing factor [Acidobacteriota bacterium]